MKSALRFVNIKMVRRCVRQSLGVIAAIVVVALATTLLMLTVYRERFRYPEQWKRKVYRPFSEGLRPDEANLEFYNLSGTVDQRFECVQTKTSPSFSVCLYPTQVDGYISHDIWSTGLWEPDITGILMGVLNSSPESVFIDVGANVGYFTLLAARSGHFVVAVEPDPEHVARLARGVGLAGLERRVAVLRNAVAERRTLGTVRRSGHNQGDTQIEMEVKECRGSCPPTVKTIALNDLTKIVYDLTLMSADRGKPRGPDSESRSLHERLLGARNEREVLEGGGEDPSDWLARSVDPSPVVLKVDTQGFEHRIFDNPDFFFDRNSVSHVFMEWGTMARAHPLFNKTGELPADRTFAGQRDLNVEDDSYKVEVMIRFLSERGYRPYSTTRPGIGRPLNPRGWNDWPHDVVWCHDSQAMFMFKMGLRNIFGP